MSLVLENIFAGVSSNKIKMFSVINLILRVARQKYYLLLPPLKVNTKIFLSFSTAVIARIVRLGETIFVAAEKEVITVSIGSIIFV